MHKNVFNHHIMQKNVNAEGKDVNAVINGFSTLNHF